jgi:hypothetical protein
MTVQNSSPPARASVLAADKVEEPRYFQALSLLASLFFAWGFITVINNTLLPHLRAVFASSYTQTTLLESVWFIAYFFCLDDGPEVPEGKVSHCSPECLIRLRDRRSFISSMSPGRKSARVDRLSSRHYCLSYCRSCRDGFRNAPRDGARDDRGRHETRWPSWHGQSSYMIGS